MEILLPLVPNLSLHWLWLGSQISSTFPFTVHILCLETHAPDALFQTFAINAVPWTTHCNASKLSSAEDGHTVLILVYSVEETKRTLTKISQVDGAFRTRYLLVQDGSVSEKVIETLVRFAWSKHLTQTVFIRLEDRAIYAVLPKCQEPDVTKVSSVQWPDLQKLDLRNCTLKIATSNFDPFIKFTSDEDSSMSGSFEPMYRYAKVALKFQAVLVNVSYFHSIEKVLTGEADMLFVPLFLSPNLSVEISPLLRTMMMWCVPDSCVLGTMTYILWGEFTWFEWILLAASVFAVSFTVRWMAPKDTPSLVGSFFTVVSTLASTAVKLPKGSARGVLAGWLFGVLVLSTAYQTALHSMMSAPVMTHEIEDVDDLLKSEIDLLCWGSSCSQLNGVAKDDTALAGLAARSKEMDTAAGFSFVMSHQQTSGVYTSSHTCSYYYTRMRALIDERTHSVFGGVFGVLPSSWLAPAFRQMTLRLEASGLSNLWFHRDAQTPSRSTLENRELQPITVALLWPAVLLMCCGSLFAFTAFVIELCWFWQKSRILKFVNCYSATNGSKNEQKDWTKIKGNCRFG